MWDAAVLVTALLAARLAGEARATPLESPPRLPGLSLSPFVRHWEPALYEPMRAEARRRRATHPLQHSGGTAAPPPHPLRLSFRAHNREFKLRLRPDPGSVFAESAEIHSTAGPLHYSADRVYSGTLEDEEDSHVYGVLTADGLFDGTISTRLEEYYVEPLHRYGVRAPSPHLHSVVYRHSDVLHPARNLSRPCASQLLHRKRQAPSTIDSIFDLGTDDRGQYSYSSEREASSRRKRWLPEEDEGMQEDEPRKNPELPLDLDVPYTRNTDFERSSTRRPKTTIDKSNLIIKIRDFDDDPNSRPKPKTHVENHVIKTKAGVVTVSKDIVRKEPVKGFTVISSMGNTSEDNRHVNKRATVDPRKTTCMVYLQADHMFYQRYGSEEACIEVMTRHVQKVNAIYKVTDFNQDGKPDNITFMIKRIKVHTLDALKEPSYRFPNNYGVEKYLELFSEEDYDAFCLAYMFTYRDFEMGTLGLAWTGDLKNAGGVCEKNGHYRGSMKSLNTGIVTLLNYGKHVPPAVSHVTLAHEIGHNFGSPHDPEVCTPGGEDGNYIMFARATSGDKKNNNKFSPCSLRAIDPVLNNKARSAKGCFTEPQPAICGNGVVEEGEECDCGWAAECTDVCCRPQAVRPHYKPCTLTENSVCSPSQGPCCTAKCTLKFGDKCRDDNGCRDASYCDGKRAQCPSSRHKPNRTRCDKEFVCYIGECTGSICLAYGLESCQCAPRPEAGPRAACELCCRAPGGPCRSSFQWNSPPYDVPDMYAKPGTPCNDYNGYCDVFQKCREVDPSGPLATLRKLLLSDESIASFKKWLLDHWYAVLLILLAVIALLVASTRWLGRRSDGKLKSVTIIHSSTTETVRLPDANQQGLIVHTAVRSKLPLKKKVALKTRAYRNRKQELKNKSPDNNNGASPAHAPSNNNNNNNNNKRKNKSTKAEETRPKVIKESTAVVSTGEGKPPKHVLLTKHNGKIKKRKGKLKKETIDYSAIQKDATLPTSSDNDALSKVQKWLLSSPQPVVIPKSKSTPIGLTERNHRSPQKLQTSSARKTRPSKSAGNLLAGEKARLQVVYKPPFRFSVKICKSDKTKVVLDKSARQELDKRRAEPGAPAAAAEVTRSNSSNRIPKASNRTSTEPGDAAVPAAAEPAPSADGESNYANVLPRSVSDCKLGKKHEARSKGGHRKSNSVGQKKETTESKQSLLAKEESGAHVYENMLVSHEAETAAPRSCSMPRRHAPAVARQSSYSHLPRAHALPRTRAHTHSTNNLTGHPADELEHFYNTIETLRRPAPMPPPAAGDTGTGSSSSSSRKTGGSGERAPPPRLRYSMPSEHYNVPPARQASLVEHKSHKLRRQLSDNEIPAQHRRKAAAAAAGGAEPAQLRGFQLVVGKEKLKRQLSESELRGAGAGARGQVCMPVSAGAECRGAPGPDGFQWPSDALHLKPNQVPNERANRTKRASGRGERRAHTFGELKGGAPDCGGGEAREEVLVSPEDFLKIIDT